MRARETFRRSGSGWGFHVHEDSPLHAQIVSLAFSLGVDPLRRRAVSHRLASTD